MAMRHGGGEERSNASRSAVESGEAARDEAPSAVARGCLSPRWKCVRLHGSECSAETGADKQPLIAVSAGNFNIADHSTWLFCFSSILIYALSPSFPLVGSVIRGFYWLFLWNFKEIKHQQFSMTQPCFFLEVPKE